MRLARVVVLSLEHREMMESRARARSVAARSVERARIVLLAATPERNAIGDYMTGIFTLHAALR